MRGGDRGQLLKQKCFIFAIFTIFKQSQAMYVWNYYTFGKKDQYLRKEKKICHYVISSKPEHFVKFSKNSQKKKQKSENQVKH